MPDIEYEILHLQKSKQFSVVDVSLEKLTDAQLLERDAGGDENAFRELVVRYKDILYTFLRRYLNKQDLIEDVFQDTFLKLYLSRDSFDMNRPLRPWLFTIAANKAKDTIRKLQKTREIPIGSIVNSDELSFNEVLNTITSDNATPTSVLEKNEKAMLVKEIISILPVNSREILLLAYFNGFSYKQIADMLGIPIGTVKSRLHTAVGYFAELWKSMSESKVIK